MRGGARLRRNALMLAVALLLAQSWRRGLPAIDAIELAGQRREIATLFTDIASFTALVETLEPDVLGPLLNEYLTGMTGYRVRPRGHSGKNRRRCFARTVRRPGRAAGPCRPRGRLRLGLG